MANSELTIDDLIKDIKRSPFLSISKEQKDNLLEIFNKEKIAQENQYDNLLTSIIVAFISLVDYISRNHELFPHTFQLEKSSEDYIGEFTGEFRQELYGIQNIMDSNPISFYADSSIKQNLPQLNFSKDFDSVIKSIEKNFISDFDNNSFHYMVKNYNSFKLLDKSSVAKP